MLVFDIIKAFLLTSFTSLIYLRLDNKKGISLLKRFIRDSGYTIMSALILICLSQYVIEPLKSILAIAIWAVLISIIEKSSFKRNFFFISISYVVSCVLYLISIFVSSILSVVLFDIKELNIWFMLLTATMETALILIVFKIKFKMIITYNKNIASASTTIVGILLVIYSLIREDRPSNKEFTLLLSGVILCGLGLYWWIKRESITSYNEKSQERINSKLREENNLLNEIRLRLEKALHTDSKKLPAYQEAVEHLIVTTDNAQAKRKAIKLLGEINLASLEFSKELTWEVKKEVKLPTTGMELVDAIFRHYGRVAAGNGIDYDLIIDGNLSSITEIITQSQLETLVSNLLDNAIIAINKSSRIGDKRIITHLWSEGLSVEDNGTAFKESVLTDLERCKKTLIPDEENGGGIGYATIFEILNECEASLEIKQDKRNKSVTVRFNGNNQIITKQRNYEYE